MVIVVELLSDQEDAIGMGDALVEKRLMVFRGGV